MLHDILVQFASVSCWFPVTLMRDYCVSLSFMPPLSRIQRGDPGARLCPVLWLIGPERAAAGDQTTEAAAGEEHPDQHGTATETGGAAAQRNQPLRHHQHQLPAVLSR